MKATFLFRFNDGAVSLVPYFSITFYRGFSIMTGWLFVKINIDAWRPFE